MKISDLRQKELTHKLHQLKIGDWFIENEELYRVFDREFNKLIPCVHQNSGIQADFKCDAIVTPVEVEINIIS